MNPFEFPGILITVVFPLFIIGSIFYTVLVPSNSLKTYNYLMDLDLKKWWHKKYNDDFHRRKYMKKALCKYNFRGDPNQVHYVIIMSDDDWESAYDDSGSYLWTSREQRGNYIYSVITDDQLENLLNG